MPARRARVIGELTLNSKAVQVKQSSSPNAMLSGEGTSPGSVMLHEGKGQLVKEGRNHV